MRKTATTTSGSGKIRVGQHIRFPWGISHREGIVIEDRGPLDVGGGQVIRIRYFVDFAGDGTLEPVETETGAKDVEVIGELAAA